MLRDKSAEVFRTKSLIRTLLTACILSSGLAASAASPTPDELDQAHAWAAARFGGPTQAPSTATGPFFSFDYDGKPAAALLKTWQTARASRPLDDMRTEHTLSWTEARTGLQIRCVAIEYRDFPTVEWTLFFKNTGSSPTPLLSDIQPIDLSFEKSLAGDFVLHHHSGDSCTPDSYQPLELVLASGADHRFAPQGGRPTTGAFPYFNLAWPGGGVIVVVGWPGQWQAQFTRQESNRLRVRAGQELTHLRLRPGEEIRTPLIVLQFWKADQERAQNVWRRWMLAHNLPRTADGQPPRPMLSSCSGGFFPGLQCSIAGERQFINAFVQAGLKFDYWWDDAGWYPCRGDWSMVGTWTPDLSRFPRGLKSVSDLAHTNGMGFIVWFEPERVSPGTWLYTNHPAWLLGRDGHQKLLNLGHPPARQWLTDHVDAMLTREGIDFYRQDFNIDPLPYWRANDAPDRQGLTEIRHLEGYLEFWDALRRRHPNLRIDSCASGGRRNDLETLRRAVPLLRSDYQAFDGNPAFASGNQGHTYGLSSWIPYYGQGVYYSDNQYVYSARSYLCPAFGMAVDVRRPGLDWALIRRVADQWRKVAPCYLGDFYPLTPYRLGEDVWMAWQFHLPNRAEGLVQAFRRRDCPFEAARFKLRGLETSAEYLVSDLDQPDTPQRWSGAQLMERGFLVTLPEKSSAALLSYRQL